MMLVIIIIMIYYYSVLHSKMHSVHAARSSWEFPLQRWGTQRKLNSIFFTYFSYKKGPSLANWLGNAQSPLIIRICSLVTELFQMRMVMFTVHQKFHEMEHVFSAYSFFIQFSAPSCTSQLWFSSTQRPIFLIDSQNLCFARPMIKPFGHFAL